MYNFLTKNGQALAFGVGVVLSIIFMVLIIAAPSTADLTAEYFTNMTSDSARVDALKGLTQFDFGLYATYALVVVATVAAIAFGLYQFIMTLIENPKAGVRTLFMIGGIIIFFFVGKAMSPSVDSKGVVAAAKAFNVSEAESSLISGSINATLIILVVAVVVLIVAEVRNLFK